MRVLLDTNTVVSGFLWGDEPRALIDAALDEWIELFTCNALIEELEGVLPRRKLARRLAEKQLSIPSILERYRAIANIVEPAVLSGAVSRDPDDDLVLATALSAQVDFIVSGDKHLRNLKHFHSIPILSAALAIARIRQQRSV